MTHEEIRDLYLEITDLLIYKDSVDDAKKRVNDTYSNSEVKTLEDFNYELCWGWNEETGGRYSGEMFIKLDWKVNVEEAVWQTSQFLGEVSKDMVFPQESDIKKDAYYSDNVLMKCAMSVKERGIELGSLDSEMDVGLYFLTEEENYVKVSSIFEKLSTEPLRIYKRD